MYRLRRLVGTNSIRFQDLGISLPVLQGDGQSVWDPCFEQSSLTKWTG